MKFNSVTWYSKLAAAILFIALPFAGFYAGMKYQEAISSPDTDVVEDSDKKSSDDSSAWETLVRSDEITVKTKYEGGKIKYSGTVQTPTPCHEIKDETKVLESFPEQVQIRLLVVQGNPGAICAQVISEKEFSGEVEVSKDATISVHLDGKEVK
jgi:hypothetical protein